MDRRELLMGLGLAPLAAIPALTEKNITNKEFLFVIYLGVGYRSASEVDKYVDLVRAKLMSTKPDGFHHLLIPKRVDEHSLEVYALGKDSWFDNPNEDRNENWLEEHISSGALTRLQPEFSQYEEDRATEDKEILDCVFLMMQKINSTKTLTDYVNNAIAIGRKYHVLPLKEFVLEYIANNYEFRRFFGDCKTDNLLRSDTALM